MQTTRGTSITGSASQVSHRPRRRWLYVCLSIAVALAGLTLDIITKQLAVKHLDPANPPVLFGGLLRLQLIRNSGAAFSLGAGYTPVFAVLATAALVFVIVVLLRRLGHVGWAVALGLLMAGVAGNLVDRIFRAPGVFRGHVVDYLQLPHWAIFNVADMCVCAAAALIVILAIFKNVSLGGEHYARANRSDQDRGHDRQPTTGRTDS